MAKWTRLDLRSKSTTPDQGELVALRLVPKPMKPGDSETYEIGRFVADKGSKKLWWRTGRNGSWDPVKMKQHYDIWWYWMPHFDGIKF